MISAILVVYLLTVFFKAVSDAHFVEPLKSIGAFAKSVLKSVLRGTFKAVESPIERPKTKLVVLAGSLVFTYLACLLFFALFLLVAVLFIFSEGPRDPYKQFGAMGITVLLFYLTVFFRAEADRDWLALKEQWKIVRANRNA